MHVRGSPLRYIDSDGLQIVLPLPPLVPGGVSPGTTPGVDGEGFATPFWPGWIRRILNNETCEKKCPPCNPPAGTVCWIKNVGHSHKGLDPHYHTAQMNQDPNCVCRWNDRKGKKYTFASEPLELAPCSAYGYTGRGN